MYRVDRNNFYKVQKNATVYTPDGVSEYLFHLLKTPGKGFVVDPCVGGGSLLKPFAASGYDVLGIDVENQGYLGVLECNFLALEIGDLEARGFAVPDLVIANPPFNIDAKTAALAKGIAGGRPLLPEVWLRKIVALWGREVPICLFAPYGLRLNQTCASRRWRAFVDGTYPPISAIVALPKDIYEGVMFHSEVLIFNRPDIAGHYFYHD